MISIGLLHTTIRGDEKLIIGAARRRKVKLEILDVRNLILDARLAKYDFDAVLDRCVSNVKGLYATHFFESLGIHVINKSSVVEICQDKFLTSLALLKAKVPQPGFAMAFNIDQSLDAISKLGGFPIVVKPAKGSWGRLLAKVNDKDALEAVIEHKLVLGTSPHGAFYIQKYIKKNGRDIRAFAIDGVTICAIYRESDHWITNTARGAKASNCRVTKDISNICRAASEAVGSGILAIDLIEEKNGFLVNEINHTMEFKNSEAPTGVSISGAIIDYCIKICKK